MDNLLFTLAKNSEIDLGHPLMVCYEHATKTIVVLNEQSVLHFLTINAKDYSLEVRASSPAIDQLLGEKVTLFEYLVDSSSALLFTESGSIMTINQDGMVQIHAQNEDGITGGSVSPTQEDIYVVTNNNTLIQLNSQFDLVQEVPLDDHPTEKAQANQPKFSWKADGSFFAINIQTDCGRKCHTRDSSMAIFRSPSLSDPDPEGLVQSVSEKSRGNMSQLVSWQPSGGIIAGADYFMKGEEKVHRIIFWEKNTLRHLDFKLPHNVMNVVDLRWSPDSQILLVEVLLKDNSRWAYFYYRANYHWFLKQTLKLDSSTQYILMRHQNNAIVLIKNNQIQVMEFKMTLCRNTWKNQDQQQKNGRMVHFFIDGPELKISDFSRGLIPPPMSHSTVTFSANIRSADVHNDLIMVITETGVILYDWASQNFEEYDLYGNEVFFEKIIDLNYFEKNKFSLQNNSRVFELCQNKTIKKIESVVPLRAYSFEVQERKIKIDEGAELVDRQLTVQGSKIASHCSSFIFYKQFLIFTCSTSEMYDSLYVLDLELDSWMIEDPSEEKMKLKLSQFSSQKLLNARTIERGSKIVCCAKNRVIFQLPRGNLQGINPKVVMIKHVKKCMEKEQYKEAFQTIRTHKLDLNLLFDLNPTQFCQSQEYAEKVLLGIGKPDYLNLFVSQLKDDITTELVYCLPQGEIDQRKSYIHLALNGKKIAKVCSIISETLRRVNKQKYILTIFTSDIKMGLLSDVLFEIKDMRHADQEIQIPPHLHNQKKIMTSQQILQYVCWLVDANAIYEASLLTYDVELAAMTARCTQMDPKQYIPYLESLKEITDPIELRKKICMDLKKHQRAVMEVSKGSKEQKQFCIELIQKYKLFKCGLKVFCKEIDYLRRVKKIIINELIKSGEINQAYRMALSISDFQQALQIAIKQAQGKKIKQVIESMPNLSEEERKNKAQKILASIGPEGFKNKNQLAKMQAYVGNFEDAVRNYLSAGNYQKAFKFLNKLPQELRHGQEIINQMDLLYSLHKNMLLKEKSAVMEKMDRLQRVHKIKSLQGQTFAARNRENDDMYSQVSVSSKTGSSYTISTTTGMRKKKDKKRSILSRNVKEGSVLEEEYLVAFLHDIKSRAQQNIRETKLLTQHLIYMNMVDQAENLRNLGNEYYQQIKKCRPKYYAQVRFEEDHPEFSQIIEAYENPTNEDRIERNKKPAIESFNYLF